MCLKVIRISLFLIVSFPTFSQINSSDTLHRRVCGSAKMNPAYEVAFQQMMKKSEQFSRVGNSAIIYNIPVIFHIVHNGEPIGASRNITQAQINSQLVILNEDFRKMNSNFSTWVTQTNFINAAADCEINFCMAKVDMNNATLLEPGINRIDRNTKGWGPPPYQGETFASSYVNSVIKPASIWDPTKYMNIWILEFAGNTLGFAQFPTIPSGTTPINDMVGNGGNSNSDGVVIDYKAIGNIGTATSPYNKGRTLTHEAGHWFGLWHINNDASCGNDYCNDTPTQYALSGSCPTLGGANVNSGCTPNTNGKMYQNYMDYSDDKCMAMFTNDQKARMHAVMANCINRFSLNSSTVCSSVGINENTNMIKYNLYPNPSSDKFNLEVAFNSPEEIMITIENTLGQIVKKVNSSQTMEANFNFDLSECNKGIYFISIRTKTGISVKRLILQ